MCKTFIEIVKSNVEKFNPYHDRFGRFTTGSGFGMSSSMYTGDPSRQAVTFSAKPDTVAGANAIARRGGVVPTAYGWNNGLPGSETKNPDQPKKPEKQPEKPKAHNNMYPETLAGVKQGKEMDFDQANHGRTNPDFNKGGGYYRNCQTCVVANEARRRGYDVTARPKDTPEATTLSRTTNKAWIDPSTGTHPKYIDVSASRTNRVRNNIEDVVKQGERYTVEFGWKGSSYSGHIISVERNSSGNVRLYDPQSGRQYTGNDVDLYLKRVRPSTVQMLRVDNQEFNMSMVEPVLIGGK